MEPGSQREAMSEIPPRGKAGRRTDHVLSLASSQRRGFDSIPLFHHHSTRHHILGTSYILLARLLRDSAAALAVSWPGSFEHRIDPTTSK